MAVGCPDRLCVMCCSPALQPPVVVAMPLMGDMPAALVPWVAAMEAGVGQHLAVAPPDVAVATAELPSLTAELLFEADVRVVIVVRQDEQGGGSGDPSWLQGPICGDCSRPFFSSFSCSMTLFATG